MEILPDNVLIEIFEHLNCRELIKGLRVCKRWNKLIVTSSRVMKKFCCNWDVFNKLKEYAEDTGVLIKYFEELEAKLMKFPFKNAAIYGTMMPVDLLDRFVEIFKKHLTTVEKLKIARPYGYIILPILRATSSNLIELIISTNSDITINELELVNLKKLKVLKLHQTTSVLSKIYAKNLTKLEITHCKDENRHVEKFFMTAKNLKSITFMNFIPQSFSQYDEMPFKLEHFELQMSINRLPENLLEFIINFLNSQEQSLKSLKIRHDSDCKEILSIAVRCMKLESLHYSGRIEIHEDMEILNNIPENSTIKDLSTFFSTYNRNSRVRINNMDIELRIIKKCRALETLKLDCIKGKLENFINEIQSCNFKSLDTHFNCSQKLTDLKYEKLEVLKNLDIKFELQIEDLLNFAASFPNIKKICFGDIEVHIYPEDFHKIFKICPKLKEIEIKFLKNNLDNLYEMLDCQDCHIEMLKIGTSNLYVARAIKEQFQNVPFEVKIYSTRDNQLTRWEFDCDFFSLSRVEDEDL